MTIVNDMHEVSNGDCKFRKYLYLLEKTARISFNKFLLQFNLENNISFALTIGVFGDSLAQHAVHSSPIVTVYLTNRRLFCNLQFVSLIFM